MDLDQRKEVSFWNKLDTDIEVIGNRAKSHIRKY